MSNKIVIGDEPKIEEENKLDTSQIEGAVKRLSEIDFKLNSKMLIGQMPFILFCFGLIVILIWSSHNNDILNKKIDKLTKENKELRNQYIINLSEIMNASRQSNIAEKLKLFSKETQNSNDTDYVKEAIVPPVKITIE
ncbi:MAG: FtsL-like putative cell division protein [Bacteroidota bacterium]